MPSDALPDDSETLKAMLLAERVQNERLRQIIKELQRHRFGRRAETLPEDQMLLGLEDVEQTAASDAATAEQSAPAERQARAREAPHQPRLAAGASAADRDRRRHRRQDLPLLPGRVAPDRRGQERAAGHRAGAVPGARHPTGPKYACRRLRGWRRAGPGAGAADRGRHADRSHHRPGAGLQICRSSAAVSPGPDLRPPGHRPRPLHAGGLGRPCRLASASAARAPARQAQRAAKTVCRRDDGAGAGSRPRPHQDRPVVGLCR